MGMDGTPNIQYFGPTFRSMILGLTPEELFRTQPHLRIVLSFVARNVAHLGLHAFERIDDNDRRRLRTGPLALLLKRPNANMTGYELLESLVSDLGLYDIAYWFFYEDANAPAGWSVQPIPSSWVVEQRGGNFFAAAGYTIQNPDGTRTQIPAENMLVFHGWNPGKPKHGASPIETLKQILAEQVQAWSYREQIWQRGGRVGAYLTRPAGSNWSDNARKAFAEEWKKRWTGIDGAKAGGTPILEEGMELKRLGFSAREEEWVEVSKLSLSTIAGVYHVNPVMVGILDNANFSNTKEFRKMLYSETLGPTLAMIEDRINTFLVPRIAGDSPVYVEFNIAEKLQGDFEEQATVLSQSAGAPWMTRNEVRAKQNLPALEGGDELVIPLNVLVGGQASPQDSGTQNEGPKDLGELPQIKAPTRRVKAQRNPNHVVKAEKVLRSFFKRQRASVLARLGSKAPEWWDEERWNSELSDDLYALSATVSLAVAKSVLAGAGLDADQYNAEQTYAFLRAIADKRADAINGTTRDQVSAILDGDGPEGADGPGHVFDLAEGERAAKAGLTLVTTVTAFSTVEVGRQNGGAEKTWVVTSSNPRPSHASLNGETVPMDSTFSNGAAWPGDSSALDVDEVAGCSCDVEISITT
jgi:HK97 family phage portal protein